MLSVGDLRNRLLAFADKTVHPGQREKTQAEIRHGPPRAGDRRIRHLDAGLAQRRRTPDLSRRPLRRQGDGALRLDLSRAMRWQRVFGTSPSSIQSGSGVRWIDERSMRVRR